MKIAIFDYFKHTSIGGVEKYVRHLIQLLKDDGHDVTEFFTMKPKGIKQVSKEIEGVTYIDASSKSNYYRFNSEKIFKRVIKSDEYDLVINNSIDSLESISNNKVINIQHMGYEFYETKGLEYTHRVFKKLFLGLGHLKNQLEAKNVVFYSKENNHGNSTNPFYIPLCNDSDVKYKNRQISGGAVLWMARHDEPHKGLKNLNKVYELSANKSEFIIAGSGKDTNKISLPRNLLIGGQTKNEVNKLFYKSKVFIMTSNYEGFGYTVVESLSFGTPVVMFDTFDSAKFFDKCESVFLIDKGDYKGFAKKIDEISNMNNDEWKALSIKATKFAKEELSFNTFKTKWREVIENVK